MRTPPPPRPTHRLALPLTLTLGLVLPAAGLAASAVSPAAAVAVAAANDIARVTSLLGRAETNLKIIDGSIGKRKTPPRGSAAKLTAQRLDQVVGDLNPAAAILEKLPADGAGVAEAKIRYAAAVAEHRRLTAILTGKPAEESGPAPADQGVKLSYQQEEQLKAATFNLREVEGNAAALMTMLETMRAVEDPLTIGHRDVGNGIATIANARRKGGFAAASLDALPEDGRGVPAARQRLVNVLAQVETAAQFMEPLAGRLNEIMDPARYPAYREDLQRLELLSRTYGNQGLWQSDRPAAAEAFAQRDAARDETIRIAQQYIRLMQQGTEQGRRIEAVGNGLLGNLQTFQATADAQRTSLPAEIRQHLAEADQYAQQAVNEQKPLFFAGGIPQRMGWVAEKLTLLTAIDPEGGKRMAEEVTVMQRSLAARAASLRELIIRENRMPRDVYAGADREAVVKIARSGWGVQQKDAQVLAVRIPAETWARETKWVWSAGAWSLVDRSKLQVRLIVADPTDPKLAIDRPVTVIRDHQKGDAMIGVPMRSIKDELQPSAYILRQHVKK